MTKPYVQVFLELHGGTEWNLNDYVDENGKYVALGTEAAAMLNRHEAIHYVDPRNGSEPVEMLIPYHAIVRSMITKSPAEYNEPEDSYCQPVGSPFAPTGSGRTVSLPIYHREGEEPSIRREDYELMFKYMMPKLLEDGIEVKFMGEKVTAVTPVGDEYSSTFTVTTSKGTHTVNVDFSGDYEYFCVTPTVDGEEVNELKFNAGTSKYFLIAKPYDGDIVVSGEYDAGTRVVITGDHTSTYSKVAFGADSDTHQFDEDKKLPALTADTWYEVY